MISVSSSMGSTTGVVGGDTSGAVAPVQIGQPPSAPAKSDAPSQCIRTGDRGRKARIVSFKCPPQRCNVVTCRSSAPKNCLNPKTSSIALRFLRTKILAPYVKLVGHLPWAAAWRRGPRTGLRAGLFSGDRRVRANLERRHLAKFTEAKVVHCRLDLLASVHDERSVSCNRFGNGHTA